MRKVLFVAAVLFSICSAFAGEIREFSVSTLERLGNELYRRDLISARATEVVLKTQPAARSLKARGWVTEPHQNGGVVYFIAETASGPCLSYTVTFRGSDKPEVNDVRGQPVPPNIAVRDKARQTAVAALKGKVFNISYDFEVLDDPDGNGFLVYALAATGKPGDVVVSGHFRVTVSADGARAERVDALSKSVMIENKNQNHSPAGYHDVATYYNQIVSDKPVETLVYANRLLGKDLYVGTPDRKIWCIHNGRMTIDTSKPNNKSAGGVARQALRQ